MRCEVVAGCGGSYWRIAAAFSLVVVLLVSPALRAAENSTAPHQSTLAPLAQAEAHVAAGEFGVAARLARQLPAHERDAVRAQIATRQAGSDARRGSLATLSSIESDALRAAAAADMRAQPLVPHMAGGGVVADFDTLIELMTNTIEPDSWIEAGGTGSASGFPTGVLVDDKGVMSRVTGAGAEALPAIRRNALTVGVNRNVRTASKLRKVSLPRLEKAVQLRFAQGQRPTDAMRNLAGLQRVQYLFVYEDTGDVVLAGPAEDWLANGEGRTVGATSGAPLLQLDDLVVVLRNSAEQGTFGCAITPTRDNLEAAQAYLAVAGKKPLPAGTAAREKWVAGLREKLGLQEIEVHGIEPGSHAARILVEADYHMKRIGMGLEPGVRGVTSYLDSMQLARGENPPAMGVLRWWFTLGDGAIRADAGRASFEMRGPSVKVLSENERLTQQGERIHTGKSEELNAQFAASFTREFDALAAKYPVYAELRNVFDLAVVAALLKQERVFDRSSWQASHWLDAQSYQVAVETAPTKVMSIANYRVIDQRTLVAGVSGGVEVNAAAKCQSDRLTTDTYGDLKAGRAQSAPKAKAEDLWWWD
jgi:hypothetical protein